MANSRKHVHHDHPRSPRLGYAVEPSVGSGRQEDPHQREGPQVVRTGTAFFFLLPDAGNQNDHPPDREDDLRKESQEVVGL